MNHGTLKCPLPPIIYLLNSHNKVSLHKFDFPLAYKFKQHVCFLVTKTTLKKTSVLKLFHCIKGTEAAADFFFFF